MRGGCRSRSAIDDPAATRRNASMATEAARIRRRDEGPGGMRCPFWFSKVEPRAALRGAPPPTRGIARLPSVGVGAADRDRLEPRRRNGDRACARAGVAPHEVDEVGEERVAA